MSIKKSKFRKMAMKNQPVDSYDVLGFPITKLKTDELTSLIISASLRSQGMEVHLCNVYTLSVAIKDVEVKKALLRSDYNIPDGWPIAFLGRKVGVKGSIRGSDLFENVVKSTIPTDIGHFFLGSKKDVLDKLVNTLRSEYPEMNVSGWLSPPFRDFTPKDFQDIKTAISNSGARIVWIGLGTPKQDNLVAKLGVDFPFLTLIPIGAVFDFKSKNKSEAPRWAQKLRIEWLFRFCQEPRRLFSRYFVSSPKFAFNLVLYQTKKFFSHEK